MIIAKPSSPTIITKAVDKINEGPPAGVRGDTGGSVENPEITGSWGSWHSVHEASGSSGVPWVP